MTLQELKIIKETKSQKLNNMTTDEIILNSEKCLEKWHQYELERKHQKELNDKNKRGAVSHAP